MSKVFFSKDEIKECTNETYEKLQVYLPRCKTKVALNMSKDDWGVNSISYGNEDEMVELINLILEWKEKAEQKTIEKEGSP